MPTNEIWPVSVAHLCGGEGCYHCAEQNPTLFSLTDKAKLDEAVMKVEGFLNANYPCGCDEEDECEGQQPEAAELVRIVLSVYGNGHSK